MIEIRKILEVQVVGNFLLECKMENGEIFQYNMSALATRNSEMIQPLKNSYFFEQVSLEFGHLSWPNGYEIHANTVVRDGELISKIAS